MEENLTPYIYLTNINNEVKNPYPLLVILILSSKFRGKIYTNGKDFVTVIDSKWYNSVGEIDTIDVNKYKEFDKLSLLNIFEIYDSIKWFFIDEADEFFD